MSAARIPTSLLPPLRKRVFGYSLRIVALYAVVGVFMTIAVILASSITPKAIHLNYDSISAGMRMSHAWNALRNPEQHPERTTQAWLQEFSQAIDFEDTNISEPGEAELARDIRTLWEGCKVHPERIEQVNFSKMDGYLERLIQINERGMFNWATESDRFGKRVLVVTILLFILTIVIALFIADGLAVRIANPLRELSAALKRKPEPGSKLKLPTPDTLETRILSDELSDLWARVSDLQTLNLQEISSQRKRLETVLASVDDAILVLDNQDTVMHCNDGFLHLIGLGLADVLDKRWRDLSSNSQNYLKLREILRPDISDQPVEFSARGAVRIFSGRCRPIYNEKGMQIASLYLLHDITEIKQKDRLKTEFIGVLSHELKTPLQSLGTASELLLSRKNALDEEGRMLIDTIHEDVGRIRGVANEFVQVSMVDLHSLRLKIEPVPISALMQQWIKPFQVLAKDRGVRIEYVQEGSGTITARIDPVKFPWAITNLLSNALRVSPPEALVTVHLTDREGMVDIEIRDEGPGIPENIQARMFDPFFQGGQIGNQRTSGFLGLGLTITKEVVEAHEGRIEYFTRNPRGSVFRIRLPLFM
jgi:PAS domain S-box-containing protein